MQNIASERKAYYVPFFIHQMYSQGASSISISTRTSFISLYNYGPVVVVSEYLFYFMMYSFLGWVLEGTYNLYSQGTFRKEGFLRGPFKPMYGLAPLLLLAVRDLEVSLPIFLLCALLIPSAVEYASGWLLQKAFHKQWWDYSGMSYQLHGHICLRFSLYWWMLSVACMYVLQPLMVLLYRQVGVVWQIAMPLVILLFSADLLWTCWTRARGQKEMELGES
ncbi:putative ABC transporter permease [Bacillus sp. FJAT-27264]|uniref:putative ABC transporter permease n=1 Tax=Paenibacillus sp. (strain DSM 101736 / FJAT-27264) TaxID=1850362 RepID=UPI002570401F|nr:putative ABC transporter permease [Bacillus sp. FJAT-27264]